MSARAKTQRSRSLGAAAVSGTAVTLAGQSVKILLLLLSTVLFARLLPPADFGLFAVAMSFVALGELLRDFGITTASARTAELDSAQASNLFWINLALGVLAGGVLAALSPVVATVFGMPVLAPVLCALAGALVVNGASAQFRAELNRELRFRALTLTELLAQAVGFAIALVVLLVAPSIWALVVQQLAVSVGMLVGAVVCSAWRPGLPRRSGKVGSFLKFGSDLFGTQLIAYVTKNVDNLAIGLVLGPTALGYYSRAYQTLMVPLNQLAAPLSRVTVPTLARSSPEELRGRTLEMLQGAVCLTFGVGFALAAALGQPLVAIVFGPGWEPMVPVFQILCIGGVFRSLALVSFWAFLADAKTRSQLHLNLIAQPLVAALMLCGLPWGIVGVAVGHTVGYAGYWVVATIASARVTSLRFARPLSRGLLLMAVAPLPAGVLAWGISTVVPLGVVWQFALGLLAGLTYLALVAVVVPFTRSIVRDLRNAVRLARYAS